MNRKEQNHTLSVSETFFSIQGESSLAGYPCFFIRLAGCNLRCSYCDARYAYEEPASAESIGTLRDLAAAYPNLPVAITGGEPLLQENVYPLMEQLAWNGHPVLVETNGSIAINRLPPQVICILDMKCPDSGMHQRMDTANLGRLRPRDELKFVLSSRSDYRWAVGLLRDHGLLSRPGILFSPVTGRLPPADLAEMLLVDRLPVRLQLQLHSLLWPDKPRGR